MIFVSFTPQDTRRGMSPAKGSDCEKLEGKGSRGGKRRGFLAATRKLG